MVEIEKTFKNIIKKGSVIFGKRQTELSIENKKAKLVVIAKNCPFTDALQQKAKEKDIPVYVSSVSSVELGYICGKAFPIASLSIIDDGGNNILAHLKQR